jgi:mono/diheme cytochrome c family protein
MTLYSLELALRGTYSYNVEYPLWTDNSNKGRYIHVPYKIVDKKLTIQSIQFTPDTKKFIIPDNTRFYKTFYKIIKQKDGTSRARRIETRIIVVRKNGAENLFGTYAWDESEQVATLVQTPYRDGTPFKDTVFKIITDETKGTTRTYGIPGRHRCFECHMGSESKSLVLGFSPLQINRRNIGEGGRTESLNDAESTQVKRFLDYGIIAGVQHTDQLPKLEWLGRERPRNNLELKANAYMVGNCAHCHNPNGFAFTKENGITLNLSAGETFNFNTFTKSSQITTRPIVHHEGELDLSHIYRKVADPPEAQGMTSQMPMHTAGAPDCKVLTVMGQWIKSFGDYNEALNWKPDCKPASDVKWIDQDFTWPQSDKYIPRRDDWNDPINGMPEEPFRKLKLTDELKVIVNKEIPVGYWNKKESCKFPNVNLPPSDQRPWMNNRGIPKRPYGEVYSTTPGSWFFRTSCMKCHGQEADGNTALARGILNWSGGSVRVANLKDGMFGNRGSNLKTFDGLGGNYLIWMAMKGTRVKFPDELSSIIGKHGGQMLNQIRDKCLRQISPDKASSPNYPDHEIFYKVCFQNNRYPGDPELAFNPATLEPKNPAIVEEWLDRAAYNGGWAIYQYLKDSAENKMRYGNDECEKAFPVSSFNSGRRK